MEGKDESYASSTRAQSALMGEDKLPVGLFEKKKIEMLEKAHTAIILNLGDKYLREVSKETTTVGLWAKLKSLYVTKSLASRLFLKQKFYSFKMNLGSEDYDVLVVSKGYYSDGWVMDSRCCFHICSDRSLFYGYQKLEGGTLSMGGVRYFLFIVDDFSRYVWILILKNKNDALSKFNEWKTLVENQSGKEVKKLRTDNDLEVYANEFKQFYKKTGIGRHLCSQQSTTKWHC
uniref:Integrase catalytic domain-containing protein n=1 Tax=Cannabis sativa TaxID=3483 RepID=A0A803Q685_CANSA